MTSQLVVVMQLLIGIKAFINVDVGLCELTGKTYVDIMQPYAITHITHLDQIHSHPQQPNNVGDKIPMKVYGY